MINLSNRKASKILMINTMNQFMVFFIIIMVIFAGIIAIGAIVNNAMISFNERERDVASLRMLGFENLQVAKIFFGESFILNTLGILIGLIFGVILAYYSCLMYSTDMYRMPFILCTNRFFETIALMLLFTIVSQSVIYRAIVKMNWFTIVNNRE